MYTYMCVCVCVFNCFCKYMCVCAQNITGQFTQMICSYQTNFKPKLNRYLKMPLTRTAKEKNNEKRKNLFFFQFVLCIYIFFSRQLLQNLTNIVGYFHYFFYISFKELSLFCSIVLKHFHLLHFFQILISFQSLFPSLPFHPRFF